MWFNDFYASFLIKLVDRFFENILSICFNSSFLFLERFKDFKASTFFYVCLFKSFPNGEYANLACSIIWLRLEGNSSPVRYSYLLIFPDDNADIFAASLLIFYWRFLSLTVSSVVMISFYILSKRFFLKHKRLSDAKVASINKKNMVLQYNFCKISKKNLKPMSDEWLNATCWSSRVSWIVCRI